MRDHPVIERMERYGELERNEREEAPEISGTDYFDEIIIEGETIVEYDGDTVLRKNLEKYLHEMGFTFKTAM